MVQAAPEVNFYITVDWEGVDFNGPILDRKDLKAFQRFRKLHPDYPMVQFLNAAYFTNGSYSERSVRKRINSVLRAGDEIGLHIHAWQNLTDAAGVPYIAGPTYFSNENSPPRGKGTRLYPDGHRGGDVPLWRYPKESIRKLVQFSLDTLVENGFTRPTSFRAGGWQTDSVVLDVLADEGFLFESSPVPVELVERRLAGKAIIDYIKKLWPETTTTSQPYFHLTESGRKILIMPNNAGLADYVDAEKYMEIFWQNLKEHRGIVEIVYGFHTESATDYLTHLEQVIPMMQEAAEKAGVRINPTTFQREAARLSKNLQSDASACERFLSVL